MKTTKNINRVKEGTLLATLAAGLFIIAFSLVMQPLSAEARGRFGPQRTPDEIVQLLTERLELTEEQVETIRPIIEEKVRNQNELRTEGAKNRQAYRGEMLKIRTETETRLNEILTDEQKAKHIELQQEQHNRNFKGKARGGKMRGGFNRTPEQAIERLSARLDLTAEQADAIKPIIQESMEMREEFFDTYQGRKFEGRDEMRSEMQAIGDETHARLADVLTEEQMDELNAMRDEKHDRMGKRMGRRNW